MMMTADPFSPHMGAVARKVLGEPNARLSNGHELRWGAHGSMSVDLEKGVWFDNEAKAGGGVLDFLASRENLKGRDAVEWLRREVGADIEERNAEREPGPKSRIVAMYDYIDENGEVVFQVCRMEPKGFAQRRPSGDGWSWGVKGVRLVPYNLPAVLSAIRAGALVFVVEGEKDVQALEREGLTATCNPGGAGKWTDDMSAALAGADVVIIPDNDDAGRNHAAAVAASLQGRAKRVRQLELPELPRKGDVSDWLGMGGDAAELCLMVEREAKAWTPEPPKSRFGAVSFADIDTVSVNYSPLIKGLIYEGDSGMIFGESGSGKSFLAVDMGLAIARGVPFLGMKTAQGPVLYQAGEGGKGLLKRLKAYRQEHRVSEAPPFILLPERVNLFSAEGEDSAEAFIAECVAWKAAFGRLSLIVIDTFSAASTGANENASEDMGRMLDAGARLQKATGAAVLWVHHKNAAGLRERGHTSFRANIETVVEVIRDSETKERQLHLVKLKDGEDGLRLGFELQSVQIGSDDDGDPITSCVVRPAQLGSDRTSKRNWLPRGQFDFLRTLETAIAQYGGMVPGVERAGVNLDVFKDLFVTVCGFGREPGAIRTALSRDSKELLLAGLIGRQDPWLWLTEKGERCL